MRQLASLLWRSSLRATSATSAASYRSTRLAPSLAARKPRNPVPAPMSATVVSPLTMTLRQRSMKGRVADAVGKQRAVVFDAHGE